MAGAGAAVLCIAGIGALGDQKSAKMGNVLGMAGVGLGLGATLVGAAAAGGGGAAAAAAGPDQFGAAALLLGGGGAVGWGLAGRVGPLELPQTVAAFHSLVGLAAVAAAAGEYLAATGGGGGLGAGALVALSLAVVIGGVTTTVKRAPEGARGRQGVGARGGGRGHGGADRGRRAPAPLSGVVVFPAPLLCERVL